jgi:hypothetical protein
MAAARSQRAFWKRYFRARRELPLAFRRHVDDDIIPVCESTAGSHSMAKRPPEKSGTYRNRQIVGVSLDPAIAKAFKAEAVQRGLSVRKLFEEMWALYNKKAKA